MNPLIVLIVIGASLVTLQNGLLARLGTLSSFLFAAICVHLVQFFGCLVFFLFNLPASYTAPVWVYFGGPLTAIFVVLIGYTTNRLGASVSITCFLTSQMITGALIDNFGWLEIPIQPLGWIKAMLVIVSILAVAIVTLDPTRKQSDIEMAEFSKLNDSGVLHSNPWERMGLIALALFNGIILTVGSTMIGKLGDYTNGAYSSFISTVLALVLLITLFLVDFFVLGHRFKLSTVKKNAEWWVYLIGWPGTYYLLVTSYLLPVFGVSLFFGVNNSFQIITALVCDHFGLVGIPRKPITWVSIAGSTALLASTITYSLI